MVGLFDPLQLGPTTLKNRCALAPMGRARLGLDGVPDEMRAVYFSQRASCGLLITGGNYVSIQGCGSHNGPGLLNDAQVAGWRNVTNRVHAAGGKIFAQMFHAGAGGHPQILPNSVHPVAPTATSWGGKARTMHGNVPSVTPRALETEEIPGIAQQFRHAALNAMKAGFDGVEIHACSGYLLDEFLCSRYNRRTDSYGGSVQNRARAVLEVAEAVTSAVGRDRVGLKISPEFNKNNVVVDDNPQETFSYVAQALSELGLVYLHVADNSMTFDYHSLLRPLFKGAYVAGVGFMPERAKAYVAEGKADLITFGRLFISNPDLPERIRNGAKLNPLISETVYVGSARGLIDYPTMEVESEANAA